MLERLKTAPAARDAAPVRPAGERERRPEA